MAKQWTRLVVDLVVSQTPIFDLFQKRHQNELKLPYKGLLNHRGFFRFTFSFWLFTFSFCARFGHSSLCSFDILNLENGRQKIQISIVDKNLSVANRKCHHFPAARLSQFLLVFFSVALNMNIKNWTLDQTKRLIEWHDLFHHRLNKGENL